MLSVRLLGPTPLQPIPFINISSHLYLILILLLWRVEKSLPSRRLQWFISLTSSKIEQLCSSLLVSFCSSFSICGVGQRVSRWGFMRGKSGREGCSRHSRTCPFRSIIADHRCATTVLTSRGRRLQGSRGGVVRQRAATLPRLPEG